MMIFRLHHGIGTTVGTTDFRLNKLSHQSENHIKDSLVVTFRIIAQIVWHTGKNTRRRSMKASTSPERSSRINLAMWKPVSSSVTSV